MLTHRFLITNTTGVEVKITGENHSCSCTTVDLEPVTLVPGASTPLTMAVRVPQGYATMDLSCTVQTDHPRFPNWIYRLRFAGYPTARIDPDRIDLGRRQPIQPADYPKVAWLEVFAPANKKPPAPGTVSLSGGHGVRIGERSNVETLVGGVRRARYPLGISMGRDDGILGPRAEGLNIGFGGGLPASATVQWVASSAINCFPAQVSFGIVAADTLPVRRRLKI